MSYKNRVPRAKQRLPQTWNRIVKCINHMFTILRKICSLSTVCQEEAGEHDYNESNLNS